jgi:uncharacterized membrane protein
MQISAERMLLLGVIVAGICLRFTSLESKAYWYDEAFTSLEVSGYSPQEASMDILTGRVVTASDLEKYQFPQTASPKTVTNTVKGIIANEPQLTPLYFIVLRYWSEVFRNSIAALRVLSALFSVAALGFAFWLCRELFQSSRVAWICVALMAVSPLHFLYAQEARPYSMWSATILLSSAVLLRALRQKTTLSWLLYALCTALSLYTYLLAVLVVLGHALYVLFEERFRLTRTVVAFGLSAAVGVAAFLPWPYRGQRSGAGNEAYSLIRYAMKWVRSIGIVFVDFNFRDYTPKHLLIPYAIVLVALVLLSGYSVYFLWRNASRRQAAFVLTLAGTVCLSLSALDLITGSSRALVPRYLFPSLVGLQIALAYLLATRTSDSSLWRNRTPWRWGLGLLLTLGLASCVMIVRADVWWNKDPENYVQSASRLINQANNPLVVSDAWFVQVLSLEHQLRPGVRYQLTVEPAVPDLRDDASTLFAFRPSAHLREELGKRFFMERVDGPADLWRLSRKTDGHRGA